MPRRFLPVMLMLVAVPLVVAQEPRDSRWTFTVAAGPSLGGPMGKLEERLVAEGWTEQYCNYRLTDCHQSPTPSGVALQFTAGVARQFGRRLELKSVVEVGDLGHIVGAKNQREIKANWKTASLAAAVMLRPMSRVRIGGGPMIALLTRQTVPPLKNNSVHAGFLLEGGVRSSERTSTFLELVVSYRRLPRLPEGPWPGNGQSSQIVGGPSGFLADFSHVTVGLGGGVRF